MPRAFTSHRALKAVFVGATAAFVLQFGGAALKYVLHLQLARLMGAEQFGAYAYSMAWLALLTVCSGLGLSMGVLRFFPEYVEHGDWEHAAGLLTASRRLTMIAGTIAAACYYVLTYCIDGIVASYAVLLLLPVGAVVGFHAELLRSQQRIELAYFPTLILQQVLVLALVVTLSRMHGGLTGNVAIAVHAAAALCVAALQIYLMRSTLPAAVRAAQPRFETRGWLRVSSPMLLATMFTLLLGQADILMVGTILGAREAGLYSAAARSAALVGLALVAGNAIVAPLIARHYARREMTEVMHAVRSGTRIALCGSVTLSLFLALFGKQVLGWFGPDYVHGYGALMILCLGQVVSAGAGPVGYLLSLTGHERTTARVYGTCAAISIAASALLVPRWGLYGAAIVTSSSMVAWNLWLRTLAKSRLGMDGFLTGA
jgi:O-antigen/teichoic acid export membrane protein